MTAVLKIAWLSRVLAVIVAGFLVFLRCRLVRGYWLAMRSPVVRMRLGDRNAGAGVILSLLRIGYHRRGIRKRYRRISLEWMWQLYLTIRDCLGKGRLFLTISPVLLSLFLWIFLVLRGLNRWVAGICRGGFRLLRRRFLWVFSNSGGWGNCCGMILLFVWRMRRNVHIQVSNFLRVVRCWRWFGDRRGWWDSGAIVNILLTPPTPPC